MLFSFFTIYVSLLYCAFLGVPAFHMIWQRVIITTQEEEKQQQQRPPLGTTDDDQSFFYDVKSSQAFFKFTTTYML